MDSSTYARENPDEINIDNIVIILPNDTEIMSVLLKKKSDVIDLYHEGFHAEQYLNIGQENYVSLGTLAREEYVYSRIMDNSNLFNEVELQGASNYITRLRRRYK